MALWKAMDVTRARGAPALFDEPGIDDRAPLRGEPGGERVERGTDFVDLGDPAGIERRDDDVAPRRIEHETVFLQEAQGLEHGLARDVELRRDLFPREAWRRAPATLR
jgi:hypothetical protein